MRATAIAAFADLEPKRPAHALVENVDLVVVRYERDGADAVSVLYGRCLHRGALMADGSVEGDNLICGVHGWDYRYETGVSAYNNEERLHKFEAWIEDLGGTPTVFVDADEIAEWERANPQPYDRDEYLGAYQDIHGADEEPHNKLIQQLAREGLSKVGHHGPSAAMGVPRQELPSWDDLQIVTAQLATKPLLDEHDVGTELVVGPGADKPLKLKIPLFVSDMSFGALSQEAKVSLAKGAELAGTGICSGEGGMRETSARRTRGTSMSWRRPSSGTRSRRSPSARRSTSRAGRAPRPAPAGTCRAARSTRRSRRSAASTRAPRRSARRRSPT